MGGPCGGENAEGIEELNIRPSTTVAQMIEILAQRSGLDPRTVQLRYDGRVLKAEQTLRECVNQSGERLQLVQRPITTQTNPLANSHVPKM